MNNPFGTFWNSVSQERCVVVVLGIVWHTAAIFAVLKASAWSVLAVVLNASVLSGCDRCCSWSCSRLDCYHASDAIAYVAKLFNGKDFTRFCQVVWLGYFGRLWPTLANFGQPWHFGPGNSRSFFFVLVLGFQLTLDFQPTRWGRLKLWDFGTKDKESHLDESLESADFSVGTHSKMQEIANVKAYQDAQLLWNQWIWARCSNEQHRATPCRTSHWNTTTFAGLLILHRLQSAITAIIAYTLYIHIIYIYIYT